MSDYKKVPLGCEPRWLVEIDRIAELRDAIRRRLEADSRVLPEWVDEYNELVERNAEILERMKKRG